MGLFGGKKQAEAVEAAAPPAAPADSLPAADHNHHIDVPAWILENAGPLSGQLTMGGVFGYCSGYALQKAGNFAAILVGAGFTFIQGLAYYGYLDVNWNQVQGDLVHTLDLDGDGEITAQDAKLALQHLERVLMYNLPAGAGFTTGLMYGMGGNIRTAGKVGLVYGLGGNVLRGVAATSAPALISLPYEAYVKARHTVERFVEEPLEKRLTKFRSEIETKSLDELRSLEDTIRSTTETYGSKDFLDAQLSEIEDMKKKLKKSRWFW